MTQWFGEEGATVLVVFERGQRVNAQGLILGGWAGFVIWAKIVDWGLVVFGFSNNKDPVWFCGIY